MKIQSTDQFKSIEPLQPIDFPDFVVLTGVNGAGKTQLLEGIHNGKSVEIPKWFLLHPGHELEIPLKNTFHSLKRFTEKEIKQEIISKIIDDIPEILSIDLLKVLKEIQDIE